MQNEAWTKARLRVEEWIRDWLFASGSGIQIDFRCAEAMKYSLHAPSKFFRPSLFLVTLSSYGQPWVNGRRCALALECVHTYSLIHDDLPAMDDDDMRRGQPSCHIRFDEATAILAGDALLTLAFELTGGETGGLGGELAVELAKAAGANGMVAGQVRDMAATGSSGAGSLEELEAIHVKKTGALIAACLTMAGIRARKDKNEIEKLRTLGLKIGLIFQVRDDILDVVSSSREMGKTVGKDAAQGKLSYPSLMGLNGAQRHLEYLSEEAVELIDSLCLLRSDDLKWMIGYLRDRKN